MKYKVSEYAFTVYSRDKKVADVYIANGILQLTRYTLNPLIQVFPRGDDTTIEDVYNFLESRCYEDCRYNLQEILASAGMTSNNPWEWCRKTHGVTYDDFYWLRFPDDSDDISWEKVKIRD